MIVVVVAIAGGCDCAVAVVVVVDDGKSILGTKNKLWARSTCGGDDGTWPLLPIHPRFISVDGAMYQNLNHLHHQYGG